MARCTIDFNKENWSGEAARMIVDGDRFDLLELDPDFREWTARGEIKPYGKVTIINHVRRGGEHFVYFWGGVWSYEEYGLVREDTDPRVAFAKVLWNTI